MAPRMHTRFSGPPQAQRRGRKGFFAALAAVLSIHVAPAMAATDDYPANRRYLQLCRYDDGTLIPQDECDVLRQGHAREVAARKQQQADLQRAMQQIERERATAEAEANAKKSLDNARAKVEHDARRAAEREAMLRAEAQVRAHEQEEERAHRAAVTAAKTKCGADYKRPAIGMPIERVRQCVAESIRVTGQLNRADGVVTTYTSNNGWFFQVMNGRIVAWGR